MSSLTRSDIVVIGGGINGAAVARDAALRGMKVVLLEKEDFGAGASTKTSKLVHGGLRYLEHFHFSLVRESLRERALLLKNAPHLVKPLAFVLPVYSKDIRPLWQIDLGLYVYDILGWGGGMPSHKRLSKQVILRDFPELRGVDLCGGCLYWDAQMLDNRLVIENILAAEKAGAIILNQAPVVELSISHGKTEGIVFLDPISKQKKKISCSLIVNATGAWSDEVGELDPSIDRRHAVPTKGVHLVLPELASKEALLLQAPQDGRVFFVIPWRGYSLVGTTDTFYNGKPDDVSVEQDDREYLLKALSFYFPNIKNIPVIASFAGLRPLAANGYEGSPSSMARSHQIKSSPSGLISITGGKFTTHRKVAEEVVDLLVRRLENPKKKILACSTARVPLPGALDSEAFENVFQRLRSAGIEESQAQHLIHTYGKLSLQILDIIQSSPEQKLQICSKHAHIAAEVTYAITFEKARTLADWFLRRTSIGYSACGGRNCVEAVAALFALQFGWDKSEREAAIRSYLEGMQD